MLKILTFPNPILNKKTAKVTNFDNGLADLAAAMISTCRAAHGIGLAAPQIGKSIRVCIINLEHMGLPPFALVNPRIAKNSWRKIEMEEGCLSVPGVFGMVKRPAKITVEAQNLNGEKNKFAADGMLARVIQHEVDHLDGVLFTSKIVKLTTGKPEEKM